MPRLLAALVTSAALAVSFVPAQAQTRVDPGAVVAGMVTLGLLAAVLNDIGKKGDGKPHHVAPPRPQPNPKAWHVQPARPQPYQHGGTHGGHKGGHASQVVLPGRCMRDVSGHNTTLRLLARACLRDAHIRPNQLPAVCEVTVPSRGGTFTGYRPNCLQARGYRVAGW